MPTTYIHIFQKSAVVGFIFFDWFDMNDYLVYNLNQKERSFIMSIGIVVYSQTGNTKTVAQKIKESLHSSYDINLETIEVEEQSKHEKAEGEIVDKPAVSDYDIIIFGAPVHAFTLAPAMKNYLKELEGLEGKKVVCFVTKSLIFNWTGGYQAIHKMKKICQSKGADISETAIIRWSASNSDEQVEELITKIKNLL